VQSAYGRINDGSHHRTWNALQIVNDDTLTTPSAPIIVWFRDAVCPTTHPPRRRKDRHAGDLPLRPWRDRRRAPGRAARWWLAQSLRALDARSLSK